MPLPMCLFTHLKKRYAALSVGQALCWGGDPDGQASAETQVTEESGGQAGVGREDKEV